SHLDGAPRGHESENDCRPGGNEQGEREDPSVDGKVQPYRLSADCHVAYHQSRDATGEEEPDHPSEEGEEQAFREELPDQAASVRADGEPNGQLVASTGCAGQEQVGHVGATDEQDEP